ncbi:MAG: PstS family phosphate ABC transporter substrate-binding protein [Bacteroidales bacterium]
MKKSIKNIAKMLVVTIVATNMLIAGNKKMVLEGSTTVLPIAQKTAEEFMKIKSGANISVRGGGSGVGIVSLIEGTCDVALASRAMRDSEMQKAISRGRDPKAFVVAMDGIAVIVNKANPVTNLTSQQVKDIYTGKISNWSKLGGPNKKIVVISRDSASGTYEAFNTLALGGAKVRPDALMQASSQGVLNMVAKTPYAIGYVGAGFVGASEEVKGLTIDNIEVSKKNVLSKKYLYSRPLYMYTNGQPMGSLKEYIDFVLSEKGQKIVEEIGFYGLK